MIFFRRDPYHDLRKVLGRGKISTRPEDLVLYGRDATELEGKPDAIIRVESGEEVQNVVRWAIKHNKPIVPRGAGSGLSGGSVPIGGGIVLSFERMDAILSIDERNKVVLVQPGVVTEKLGIELKKRGFFYPPDPSSHTVSTLGGNVAENAGGLRCFKYGVTGHYVLGLEVITGNGEVQRTGILADKRETPDWTPLLVGSEGTLGLITLIALRFLSEPECQEPMALFFPEVEVALQFIEEVISANLMPSILELIEAKALSASAAYCQVTYPTSSRAMILMEFDGGVDEVRRELTQIEKLGRSSAIEIWRARQEGDRELIWKLRRSISPSLHRLSPNRIHEDISVPRDRLLELVKEVQSIEVSHQLRIPFYGHAGDGNLHIVILYDANRPTSKEVARSAAEEIFRIAIRLGGTITGEHGVGLAKRDILSWQLSPASLSLHRTIKELFDPHNILNPGKIIPPSATPLVHPPS